ncbi:stalk domain-containing protein [Vallitalea guaymasensis]|uniref:stalk domain-containing protein n=1 Tax=Vallitalea guaymasensis TaxID=1185412 RepID=UPI000DE53567|nr:stalk domain-containing protein [Vallitalea guaymasensis]
MKNFKGFIAGFVCAALMLGLFGGSVTASIKQFVMKQAEYPIIINGEEYKSDKLPVLTWEGNTYVPLRAFADITGTKLEWNNELKRVELFKSLAVTSVEAETIVDEDKHYIEAPYEDGKFYVENGLNFVEFDGKKYIKSSDITDAFDLAYAKSQGTKYDYRISGSVLPCKVYDRGNNNTILVDNIDSICFFRKDNFTTVYTDTYIDYIIY